MSSRVDALSRTRWEQLRLPDLAPDSSDGHSTCLTYRRSLAVSGIRSVPRQGSWTPLFIAAQKGSAETIAALLEAGADATLDDTARRHPISPLR